VRFVGTVLNITDRKHAEEELWSRTRQQSAVADLGVRALAESDLQAILDEAVALVARTLRVEYCKVLELLLAGDELLLRAGVGWKEGLVGSGRVGAGLDSQAGYTLVSGEPVIVEDLREEKRFGGPPLLHEHGVKSGVSVIIRGSEAPFGVLGAHTRDRRVFTRDDASFLQAVANVLATAVEREESQEKLRDIQEAERRRMARDMHDEVLQDLTYALQKIQNGRGEEPEDGEQGADLEESAGALRRSIEGLRAAIFDLRLEGDREQTLVELLESLVEVNRRASPGLDIELSIEEGLRVPLPRAMEVEFLRIVREALNNVRRHSGAHRVRVAVGASGGKRLWAEIADDGLGFDPEEAPAGMGLRGMRERARALGGNLTVRSKPGEGTSVRFEVASESEAEEPEEARVLLVDDHTSFRQGVASALEGEPGFSLVEQAGTLAEARELLAAGPADVAVVDLGLPDGFGGDLIKDLRVLNPRAQALVVSSSVDRAETARAVNAGAAGVLHKSADMEEILDAVRRLRAGETLLPLEEVVDLLRFASSHREEEYEAHQAIARLTPREKEVLEVLAEGLDGEEIAQRLHITLKTERNHMASILSKLGAKSRLQALVFAARHGLVDLGP
jgi:signal transduction histidine kinase/DNA-binding NarL/FixJ family response regulator